MGINILGPYCIKKNCRSELKAVKNLLAEKSTTLMCPICQETYNIPFITTGFAKNNVLNEHLSVSRRGNKIDILNLDKIQRYKQKIEIEKDKWLSINVETKGNNLENIHIMIGDKKNGINKAHIIISGKTGEIRVDPNDNDPGDFINSIESNIDINNKERKAKMKFNSKKRKDR